MKGTTAGEDVLVRGGRQSLHDSRGYGRPEGDDVRLAPVEAVHLLRRGDLDAVDGDGFRAVVSRVDGSLLRVFADCRDRGFRVRPVESDPDSGAVDLIVHERGADPGGPVAFRLRVIGDADRLTSDAIADLADRTGGAIAAADGDGAVSYLGVERPDLRGNTTIDLPTGVPATLLNDRVLAWGPPDRLHERAFYGQPLGTDAEASTADDALHLSLVEAAHLAARNSLRLDDGGSGDENVDRIRSRGRDHAGDSFTRRVRVYSALRDRGLVPRSGYKFGADFRTYETFGSATDPGHSAALVWVDSPDRPIDPRTLALRVRLAGGVRKRTVFAQTDGTSEVQWFAIDRRTP